MSARRLSTRRLCSVASEHTTSTSIIRVPARSATARHSFLVKGHGSTQSAMTV
jgi:hypothetical protein